MAVDRIVASGTGAPLPSSPAPYRCRPAKKFKPAGRRATGAAAGASRTGRKLYLFGPMRSDRTWQRREHKAAVRERCGNLRKGGRAGCPHSRRPIPRQVIPRGRGHFRGPPCGPPAGCVAKRFLRASSREGGWAGGDPSLTVALIGRCAGKMRPVVAYYGQPVDRWVFLPNTIAGRRSESTHSAFGFHLEISAN